MEKYIHLRGTAGQPFVYSKYHPFQNARELYSVELHRMRKGGQFLSAPIDNMQEVVIFKYYRAHTINSSRTSSVMHKRICVCDTRSPFQFYKLHCASVGDNGKSSYIAA